MTRVVSSQNMFSWLTLSFAGVANHATRTSYSSSRSTPPTQWLAEDSGVDDSFDPVYSFRGDLVEEGCNFGIHFYIGIPSSWAKGGIVFGLLSKLAAKYPWLKVLLTKFPFKGMEATTQSLSKAYWWKMAVTAGLALGLGIYVEMMINARHAAWWDFCFGEEG